MADAGKRGDLRWHRPWVTAAVVAAVAAAFITAVTGLPRAGAALPEIARHAMQIALPQWGITEGVNEIVYGSRGWDTFGETFLLLAAVMATTVLARSREPRAEYVGEASAGRSEQAAADPDPGADESESAARSAEKQEGELAAQPDDADEDPVGAPAPERAAGMTVIVRVAARAAAPILAVASVYLAAWGYAPGGGFPAGAALTGVVILIYAAFGHRAVRRVIRPALLEPIEMAGAAAVVAVGLVGIVRKGSFLANWLPLAEQQTIRSGGTLQLFSAAELIEVATGLVIAIFMLLGMQHEWTPDENDDDDTEDAP
jgi:multicomponent Na+:H+ antiporter subunit B